MRARYLAHMAEPKRKNALTDHLAKARAARTADGFKRSREVCQAGAKKRWENWRAKQADKASVA